MRIYDIIEKKRDGLELTKEEIEFFIEGVTSGAIPDYQTTALLMAIYLNGMSDRETSDLTIAMANSGDFADLSEIDGLTVDKHSTGGVGDKTTLIVVPVVAALGGRVAKMSGRGLGHTGGTVDKLESIPGFRAVLSPQQFFENVNKIGAAMIGQSGNLAPADKKLYALRDVTATVSSIPLIASSIMSKKIASGSDCIVLDVKVGSGAFMKNLQDAKLLARQMVSIGTACGRKVAAVLTNMDIPLGNNIGNSLEVIEAVRVLRSEQRGDLYEVSVELAANMLSLVGGGNLDNCRKLAADAIEDGSAFLKLKEIVAAQGGDVRVLDDTTLFETARFSREITAAESGYVLRLDSERIGKSSVILGAGREEKDDEIDYSAGIVLAKKTGEFVNEGGVLATLYTNDESSLESAEKMFLSAVSISKDKPEIGELIYTQNLKDLAY